MKKSIYVLSVITMSLIVIFVAVLRDTRITQKENLQYLEKENMTITVPELKNGRAVILELPTQEYILIDCGSSSDFSTLYEILRGLETDFIDAVVFTSDSLSCSGGLEKLIGNFKIGDIYISSKAVSGKRYAEINRIARQIKTNINLCDEGSRIYDFDDIFIDVVSSEKCTLPDGKYSVISLYLTHNDNAVFIQGDSDFAAETGITQTMAESIKSDIYIVPNCAEDITCGFKMAECISPFYAVIPMHSDREPSDKVMDTLDSFGINTYRTDQCGTVLFYSNGKDIKLKRER